MSDTELIEVTMSADTALGDVDYEAAAGKNSVRIYLLGFGWGGPSLGMALDEPKQEDLVIDRDSYNFVFDPRVMELIRESGGLSIDFVDEAHRKGFMVQLKSIGGGCDSGGCSC